MKRNGLSLILVISLLAWSSGYVAEGAVIYDNGGPNQVNANPIMTYGFSAEDFVLREKTTVTDVHFYGTYHGDPTFTALGWTIYSDKSGAPADIFASGNAINIVETLTGEYIDVKGLKLPEIEYSFFLDTPITLDGLTRYYLALQFSSKTGVFFWETTKDSTPSFYNDGTRWDRSIDGLAFQLTNDHAPVPEPSTLLLLGSGLAGLVGYGRKRLKK